MFAAPNLHDQIDHHSEVNQQHDDLHCGGVLVQFVDFERHQRRGDDYREPLGPALLQPQSSAFRAKQRSINEAAEPDVSELVRLDARDFADGVIDIATVRVQAEALDEMIQSILWADVDQLERGEPYRNERCRFQQLEDGDQSKDAA